MHSSYSTNYNRKQDTERYIGHVLRRLIQILLPGDFSAFTLWSAVAVCPANLGTFCCTCGRTPFETSCHWCSRRKSSKTRSVSAGCWTQQPESALDGNTGTHLGLPASVQFPRSRQLPKIAPCMSKTI